MKQNWNTKAGNPTKQRVAGGQHCISKYFRVAIKTFWGYGGILFVNAWDMYKKVGVGKIDLLVHTYPNLGLQSKYRQSSPGTLKLQNSLFAPSKVPMHIVIRKKITNKETTGMVILGLATLVNISFFRNLYMRLSPLSMWNKRILNIILFLQLPTCSVKCLGLECSFSKFNCISLLFKCSFLCQHHEKLEWASVFTTLSLSIEPNSMKKLLYKCALQVVWEQCDKPIVFNTPLLRGQGLV